MVKKFKRPLAFLMSLLMIMTFSFSDGLLGLSSLVYAEDSSDDVTDEEGVKPDKGTGSESDPYQIKNYDNLIWFQSQVSYNVENVGLCAILTDDITVNEDLLANLFDESGKIIEPEYNWIPISYSDSYAYSGTFNGNGHFIKGLYCNTNNYCGLFYCLKGTVKNLIIKDSYFNGLNYTGSFVGKTLSGSKIENCGSLATVKGFSYCGGIAGEAIGEIKNCYFAGSIEAKSYANAIADDSYNNGIITNCFYLSNCGLNSARAISKSLDAFKSGEVCFLLNNSVTDGSQAFYQALKSSDYPVLNSEESSSSTVYKYYDNGTIGYRNEEYICTAHSYKNGICEICNAIEEPKIVAKAYEIANYGNLIWFQKYVDKGNYNVDAVLTDDITANENLLANLFDENKNITSAPQYFWTPICQNIDSPDNSYSGTFDGNGYSISGLYYNNYGDCAGLFGRLSGTIKNLIIKDSYFKSTYNTSSFASYAYKGSQIENCCSSATINGEYYCGGIAGETVGTINNCFFSGEITAEYEDTSGAIAGDYNDDGTLNNCFYLSDCGLTSDRATSKTKEDFASGEVCFLLNYGITNGNQSWYQTLGSDSSDPYPILDKGGKTVDKDSSTVYKAYDKDTGKIKYQNEKYTCSEHIYDEKGLCEICQKGKEPTYEDGAYQIANYGNLVWLQEYIGTNTERQSTNAVLTADIVANEDLLKNSNPKYIWTPIWQTLDGSYFNGTIDGQGHSISGLYNASGKSGIGLIGASSGTIRNLIIKDSYFSGDSYVGSFVGKGSYSNIENCGSEATVKGNSFYGGIAGSITSSIGLIKGCYFLGHIGKDSSSDNAIATGDATITNCCYYYGFSPDATQIGYSSISNGELCYLLNGGATNGQAWYQTLETDDYPVLDSSHKTVYKGYNSSSKTVEYNNTEGYSCQTSSHIYASNGLCDICGVGKEPSKTTDGIYQIATYGNLVWFQQFVDKGGENAKANAVLTDDIVINGYKWTPICQNTSLLDDIFSGTFDGAGHYISGLYCNGSSCIGLFGQSNGTIKDLTIINCSFSGSTYVGSFVGKGSGTIQNCGTNATVNASFNACGGIAGEFSGTIKDCYYLGSISGNASIDAIACSANLSNCYYLSSCGASSSQAISKTESQISAGEICNSLGHKHIDLKCLICKALEDGIVPYYNFDVSHKYNNLLLAFYMNISDKRATSSGAYVKVTLPDNTVEEYPISDADTETIESFGSDPLYVFPCNVAPWDLAKTIKVQIICPNGDDSEEFTFNLKDNLKKDCSFDNADIEDSLVNCLLNFGGFTQSYFDYSTDNLANEGIEDSSDIVISSLIPYFTPKTKAVKEGIGSFTGLDLVLGTKMTLNAYFEPEDNVDVSSLTFEVDGTTVDFSEIEEVDGKYILSAKDICLQTNGIAQDHSFKVGDLELKSSALDYLVAVLKDASPAKSAGKSDDLIKLSASMFFYIYMWQIIGI